MSQPPFESWIDRQIREAAERGAFDNLPGAGRPLDLSDDPDWWVNNKIKAEGLDAALPEPLSLRKEVAEISAAVADARTEAEVRERCDDLNRRVRAYYSSLDRTPRVLVHLVDVDAEVARWRARR